MSDERLRAAAERALSPSEPDDLLHLIHHAELPETGFSRAVDGAIRWIGSTVSWLWVALMAVIVLNVFMKNALGEGRIEFEEIQWHIYSAVFMLGLSYTLTVDDHVRVDLFYERFSLRTKAWVDFWGILLLLVPFIGLIIWYGIPFVTDSFATNERSSSPAGLPYRWLIKSALVLGCGLLLLAAVSRLHRAIALLFLGRTGGPLRPPEGE